MHNPDVQLQLAAGEITVALSAAMRSHIDPTQAEALPGRVMDLQDATNQYIELVATLKPDVYLCIRRHIRSLNDLHIKDVAALVIERAAP